MKKLLTLTLTLAVLATFSAGFAQQKAFGAETAHLYLKMTGKVTGVNPTAKTFTLVTDKGKSVTFAAAKLKALPKDGEIIDITYTESPGGPMEATTINTTKSSGLGVAQQKGEEKSRKTINGSLGGDVQLKIDKASRKLEYGKVLEVNEKAKTVTVMAKGKEITFSAAKLKSLPNAGDNFEMWGDQTGARWVCFSHPPLSDFRCFDYQPL